MNFMKKVLIIGMCLLTISTTYAVQVVEDSSNGGASEETPFFIQVIVFIAVVSLGLFLVVILITWIIMIIARKFEEIRENKSDFLYKNFLRDSRKCKIGANKHYKKRNWKFMFLFFKRKPVYVRTRNKGLQEIGLYEGEYINKENFFCLAIYNKIGVFAYSVRIILIPTDIKEALVDVLDIAGTKAYVLNCEGVDTIENVDYYLMPLIIDSTNDKNKFIDFAQLIHKTYVEKVVYEDIIKNNLLAYKDNVEKAVETNLDIHLKRRS